MEPSDSTPQNPQQPQKPSDSNLNDTKPQPPRKLRKQPKTCKLELLPPEIRADLDNCVAQDFGSKRCRKYLIENHGAQSKLVYACVGTYDHYIELHGPRIRKAVQLEKDLVANAAQDFANLKAVTTSRTPLDDQRKALCALFEQAEVRIKKLAFDTPSGVFDPRREAILNQHWKEQRAILESYHAIQEEMQKQRPEEIQKEFAAYTSMVLNWVKVAYTKTQGDNLTQDFQTNLSQVFKEGLDQWMAERKITGYTAE